MNEKLLIKALYVFMAVGAIYFAVQMVTHPAFGATITVGPDSDEVQDSLLGTEFTGDTVVLSDGQYRRLQVTQPMKVVGTRAAIVEGMVVSAEGVILEGFSIRPDQGKAVYLSEGLASRTQLKSLDIRGVGAAGTGSANDLVYSRPGNHSVEIESCILRDAGRAPVLLNGCHDWIITKTTFLRSGSVPNQHSEAISSGAGIACHRLRVMDCDFAETEGTGVILGNGDGYRIIGNYIDQGQDSMSVTIGGWSGLPCHDWVVSHNTVEDGAWRQGCIFPAGSTGNKVYNNLFLNAVDVVHGRVDEQLGNGYYDWKNKFAGVQNEIVLEEYPLDSSHSPTSALAGFPSAPGSEVPDRTGLYRSIPSMGALEFVASAAPTPTMTLPPTATPTITPTPEPESRFLGTWSTVAGDFSVYLIPDPAFSNGYKVLVTINDEVLK